MQQNEVVTQPPDAAELEGVAAFERNIKELDEREARLANLAKLLGGLR